jgi:hypothetical protein
VRMLREPGGSLMQTASPIRGRLKTEINTLRLMDDIALFLAKSRYDR